MKIKETYYRAFNDLVAEKMMAREYEWIVRLYGEIKQRLMALAPPKSQLSREIEEEIDERHLEQMLTHNALDSNDLRKIIHYLFDTCLRLGAPMHDDDVRKERDRILTMLDAGNESLATITPILILSCNQIIDDIYTDLELLKKQVS